MTASAIRQVGSYDEGIASLLDGSASGLIFKHSPYCGLSDIGHGHVEAFAKAHPDIAVWKIDVIHQRDISNRVESELGLLHESPQVILMVGGRCEWNASHRGVNQAAMAAAVGAAGLTSA